MLCATGDGNTMAAMNVREDPNAEVVVRFAQGDLRVPVFPDEIPVIAVLY
jgi:hypothetical protein